MNYSVFYLYISLQQYKQLSAQLKKIIYQDDDLRIYRCASLLSAKVVGELSPIGIHLISAQGILF